MFQVISPIEGFNQTSQVGTAHLHFVNGTAEVQELGHAERLYLATAGYDIVESEGVAEPATDAAVVSTDAAEGTEITPEETDPEYIEPDEDEMDEEEPDPTPRPKKRSRR